MDERVVRIVRRRGSTERTLLVNGVPVYIQPRTVWLDDLVRRAPQRWQRSRRGSLIRRLRPPGT